MSSSSYIQSLPRESARTINSLDSLAGSFRESSGDYFEAARAFSQCSFAEDLQKSVDSIKESGQDIAYTTHKLCEKMIVTQGGIVGHELTLGHSYRAKCRAIRQRQK